MGETLEAVLTVENLTDDEIDFSTSSSQLIDDALYLDGEPAAFNAHLYTTAGVRDTLAPREVRRYPISRKASRATGSSTEAPIAPGTYDFYVAVCVGGWWWADGLPVRVTQ